MQSSLKILCIKLVNFEMGDCSFVNMLTRYFAVFGRTLWNALPLSVCDLSLTLTQFCARLKTVILQSIRNTSIAPM